MIGSRVMFSIKREVVFIRVKRTSAALRRPRLGAVQAIENRPHEHRHHQLVVTRDLVPLAAVNRGSLNDVHARAIVTDHVEVTRHEVLWPALVKIARDSQRLEEYLRHDDRAAEVQYDPAIVQRTEAVREPAKVAVTRIAN